MVWRSWREDLVLFVGLAGLGYETIVVHVDRPVLLPIFASMVGVKYVLGVDRRSHRRKDGSAPQDRDERNGSDMDDPDE